MTSIPPEGRPKVTITNEISGIVITYRAPLSLPEAKAVRDALEKVIKEREAAQESIVHLFHRCEDVTRRARSEQQDVGDLLSSDA